MTRDTAALSGEPRTEAGKRLRSFFERGFDGQDYLVALDVIDTLIAEIEAEAGAALSGEPRPGLREALEQALEDMDEAWGRLTPVDGPMSELHTGEGVATVLWFGMERVRAALSGSPQEEGSRD